MMRATEINEIAAKIKDNYPDHEYVGVRVVNHDYDGYDADIGDYLEPSHVWIDGAYTDDTLDGTSAISLNGIPDARPYNGYMGDRILVIAGTAISYGVDPGEVIIRDARIVDIINQ